MRLMGKRQIGEIQPFELVVAIMISELATVPMQDAGKPLIHGIIPIITILTIQITLSLISLRSNVMRGVICGKPAILIEKGRIVEKNLRSELYTLSDLLEHLRMKDVTEIRDVDYAILETNGQLSVLLKDSERLLTKGDAGARLSSKGYPVDLVMDGRLITNNLKYKNLTEDWLYVKLKERGIHGVKDILLLRVDDNEEIYLQMKELRRVVL
jgi:uncharacterized membrane protein YcaP (DUF421 family)